MEYFKDSSDEASYYSVRLQPLLFQDDVARIAPTVKSAQAGNAKMEVVAETKLLDYNHEKSGFLIIGGKKSKQKMQKELDVSPLMFCNKTMKEEKYTKYLGDWLSTNGLADSVKITVNKRLGLVQRAIADIRIIVDDCRNSIVGGLATGIQIWESAVLPGLLFNSECWMNVSNSVLDQLERVQLKFYRTILAVGSGCPLPIIYWDTGGILMNYRIIKRKLLFFHHPATLPSESLAKEIFEVQKVMNLPGLVSECQKMITNSGVINVEHFSKPQWKSFVSKFCKKLNEDDLLTQTRNYKKLDYNLLKLEKCETKKYMVSLNLFNARLKFKIRAHMTPTIQMNFKNDPVFKANLWMCLGCDRKTEDSQTHVLECNGYADLRDGKDLESDKDLVAFFAGVIARRMNLSA